MIGIIEYQQRFGAIITGVEPWISPDGGNSHDRQAVLSNGTRRLIKASGQMCVTVLDKHWGRGD